jgi:ABC-type amino acid transport substrate-binding protein
MALLLPARDAAAGDLADVQARGRLVMLAYPVQENHFVSADLDVMREHGSKLLELRDPEAFRGIDVELMKGFAKSLGVALEIHPLTGGWGALLPALNRGEGDLVADELTITPARLELADFTVPYVSNWVVVVAREGSPINSTVDLVRKTGAALKGSSQVEFLQKAAPGVTIIPSSFDLESLAAVEAGRVDFALMDSGVPPGETVDSIHPTLKVAFRMREIGDGIAVRKGSDLLAPLNAYLARLKESGRLRQIFDRNGFRVERKSPESAQSARP